MKYLKLLIGLAISGLLLYWTLQGIEEQSALNLVQSTNLGLVAAALTALAFGYVVRIARWTIMLRAFSLSVRWKDSAGPFLASFALNNLLPFRVGDVARCFAFRSTLQIRVSAVLATVLVERVLDLVTLLGLFALIAFFATPSFDGSGQLKNGALILGALLIPLIVTMFATRVPARGILWLRAWPPLASIGPVRKILYFLLKAVLSLKVIGGGGRNAPLLVLSVVGWLLEGVFFLLVARSLQIDISWAGALFTMAAATLATLIPSTPGYVGTFDLFAKLALMAFGASETNATVAALAIHFFLWAFISVLGLAYIGFVWGISPTLGMFATSRKRGRS